MKKFIVISVVLILIAAGVFYVRKKNGKKDDLAQQMQFETVERGDLVVSVSATGVVKPELSANISPEAEQRGAKIVQLRIEEGDSVKKGDIIAELDKSTSLAVLKGSEANLKGAKAQLDLLLEGARKEEIEKAEASSNSAKSRYLDAKQNYQRTKDLFEKGFVSEKDNESAKINLDIAENDLKQASAQLNILKAGSRDKELEGQRARVKQAEANYEQAKASYESTIIYSPISGVITNKLMEEGQIAYPGSIIAKVTDLNTLQVVADVDETDIGGVKIGDLAEMTLEAIPELKLEGVVSKISSEAKINGDITYFEATIDIKNKNKRLKPGMTSDVDIILKKSLSTLTVSSTAVKRNRRGDYTVLFKEKDKTIPKKIVEVGIKTQDKYEILEGLKEGDTIVGNYALIKKEESTPAGILGTMRGPGRQRTGGQTGGQRGGGFGGPH